MNSGSPRVDGRIDTEAVLETMRLTISGMEAQDEKLGIMERVDLAEWRDALTQEIADHELDRTRAEALERWGEAAEQALVYAATVTDNPMVDKVCMDRAIEWADITLAHSPEEAQLDEMGKPAQARIEALEKARSLAISEWSTWKDVLMSNMREEDWQETMDGLRAPAALAAEEKPK